MDETKKILFSGIQPSGDLTIGNYLGALKNWAKFQDKYECYFSVVDLHAITVKQEPKSLRAHSYTNAALYLASGIDPEKATIFVQSHVPTHCQASWILGCYTYMGELSRMIQYKEKSKKYGDSIGSGLLNYPVLMAADILLYNTDLVPVGKDQTQHLELARTIAQRFNNLYSPTFKLPQGYIPEEGAKIMDLQEPTKKMSKSSDNPNSFILILDPPDVIKRKINRAVTDTEGVVRYSDNQPGIKNLINILGALTEKTPQDIENEYQGKGYAEFKSDVTDAIVNEFEPIQKKVADYLANKDYIESIFKKGDEKALYVSSKTLRKMERKIGFIL